MRGGFFGFPWPEITPPIVRPLIFGFSLSIKWFLPFDEFLFRFFFFFFYLFVTDLLRHVVVLLYNG